MLIAAYERPLTLHQVKLVYLSKELNKDDSFEGFLENTAAIFNLSIFVDMYQIKQVMQYHGRFNSHGKIAGMGVLVNVDLEYF